MQNNFIKNQKGQGMIESVMIIPLAILFMIYTVQLLLYLTVEIAIDDAIENFALCQVQSKPLCQSLFTEELNKLPLRKIQFHFNHQGSIYTIQLQAEALRIFHFRKIRTLKYETQI